MSIAVCLVSGGLDSCVSAAVAVSRGKVPAFLHVGYGQLTQEREEQAFEAIADFYEVQRRLCVSATYLEQIGGSALTDRAIPLPEGELDRPGIPLSYVPFRNANLLAIATSWAEVLEARQIYIGAVEEDSSGYPDCRGPFFEAFSKMIREGTKPETELSIETPLLDLRKKDIVLKGIELGAPLHLTWSCYQGTQVACGRCDSCRLRLRGFAEAGVIDPIPYETRPEGGCD